MNSLFVCILGVCRLVYDPVVIDNASRHAAYGVNTIDFVSCLYAPATKAVTFEVVLFKGSFE